MKDLKQIMTIVASLFLFLTVSVNPGVCLESGSGEDGYEQEADNIADKGRPNPMETTNRTMPIDPLGKKPAFFDQKGKSVNLQNKAALQGKTLFDKAGNKYQMRNGKLFKISARKQLSK